MGAFWLKPSLYQIVYKDNTLLNFLGIHKTRKFTKEMDFYKNDSRMYAPKMNFSVYTASSWESFPIFVEDSTLLVAGITLIDSMNNGGDSTIKDQATFLARSWEGTAQLQANPYVGFNPQEVGFVKMLDYANKLGYTDIIERREPIWSEDDIQWLKGCSITMKRAFQENDSQITREMVILGKDTRYNQVVVGLKKEFTWKRQSYARIVPLKGNGSYFLACLLTMISHPPSDGKRRYNVISATTFERKLQENVKKLGGLELKNCPLTSPMIEFTKQMGIDA